MPFPGFVRLARLLLLPVLLGACDGPVEPGVDPLEPRGEQTIAAESDLIFIRFAPDAPALADTIVSFWAVRGEDRQVKIRYLADPLYGNGGTCLEFHVPGNALLRYPDGRTFQQGDSVRITIRVVNQEYFKFEFEPAGLQFDADAPAELRVYYDWSDPDYNGDGIVDEQDEKIHERFRFWRQEEKGEPWADQVTEREESIERARTLIRGFTRYALATN